MAVVVVVADAFEVGVVPRLRSAGLTGWVGGGSGTRGTRRNAGNFPRLLVGAVTLRGTTSLLASYGVYVQRAVLAVVDLEIVGSGVRTIDGADGGG